jgi:hypothetical protein
MWKQREGWKSNPCKWSNKRSKRNRKEHNVYGRSEGERVGRRKAVGKDDVGRRTDSEGKDGDKARQRGKHAQRSTGSHSLAR